MRSSSSGTGLAERPTETLEADWKTVTDKIGGPLSYPRRFVYSYSFLFFYWDIIGFPGPDGRHGLHVASPRREHWWTRKYRARHAQAE